MEHTHNYILVRDATREQETGYLLHFSYSVCSWAYHLSHAKREGMNDTKEVRCLMDEGR